MFLHAVEFGEAAFHKGSEAFDPIDMDPTDRNPFRFIEAQMFVIPDIDQAIIATPAVGGHNTRGVHPSPNHRLQRGSRTIWNQLGIDLPVSLKDAKDRLLVSAPPPEARRAKETLIHLDNAKQHLTFDSLLSMNGTPEPPVIAIDRVAIDPQNFSGLGGSDIHTKQPENFFDFVGT